MSFLVADHSFKFHRLAGSILFSLVMIFQGAASANVPLGARVMNLVTQNHFFLNEAMTLTLRTRCEYYLLRVPNIGRFKPIRCQRATARFRRALNHETFFYYEEGERHSTQIVFRDKLKELLVTPKTLDYLSHLGQQLRLARATGQSFKLFELTDQFAGSRERAFELIATLFQDTSPTQSALRWLEIHPVEDWSVNVPLSLAIVEELAALTHDFTDLRSGLWKPNFELALFPEEFQSVDNPKVYHFYVPGYLAMKMAESGVQEELSFFQSYLFNYLYKIFHGEGVFQKVIHEPKGIEDHQVQSDIYLGYAGTSYALNLDLDALSFSEFQERLSLDPSQLNLFLLREVYK